MYVKNILAASMMAGSCLGQQDTYQSIGRAVGSVYSRVGSIMANPTASLQELIKAEDEAAKAIATLRSEVANYDWRSLLGVDAAASYKDQLETYVNNLGDVNQQIRSRVHDIRGGADAEPTPTQYIEKDVTKSTALEVTPVTSASSLFPVPSDLFSDTSDNFYPIPTIVNPTITSTSASATSTNDDTSVSSAIRDHDESGKSSESRTESQEKSSFTSSVAATSDKKPESVNSDEKPNETNASTSAGPANSTEASASASATSTGKKQPIKSKNSGQILVVSAFTCIVSATIWALV